MKEGLIYLKFWNIMIWRWRLQFRSWVKLISNKLIPNFIIILKILLELEILAIYFMVFLVLFKNLFRATGILTKYSQYFLFVLFFRDL